MVNKNGKLEKHGVALGIIGDEVSMNLNLENYAKALSKGRVSNCSSAEVRLLEWTKELLINKSILVKAVRKQLIDSIQSSNVHEYILNFIDTTSEIENTATFSFVGTSEILELKFRKASFRFIKSIVKKISNV